MSSASSLVRCDVARYFALAEAGEIGPGERTELLDGIIVAMTPPTPLHNAAVYRIECALREAFPVGSVIRVQMSLIAGADSVPEPDIAVLPGREIDYVHRHPSTAMLLVEVALTTVAQDRLTKSRIYARAGVRNYWVVQPELEWVEVYRDVDPERGQYGSVARVGADAVLVLDGVPGIRVPAGALFPNRLSG